MADWTLRLTPPATASTTLSFAEWGIDESPEIAFRNQDADVFTFSIPGDIEQNTPFVLDSFVEVFRDGAPYFCGHISEPPKRRSSRDSERFEVTVSGPWWHLSQIIYQQLWAEYDQVADDGSAINKLRSSIILHANADGTKINTSNQLHQIIDYAIAAGVNIQKGAFINGVTPWSSSEDDQSCADLIRATLDYIPDAVVYFDYSTTPTTINVRDASDLTALT